MKRTASITLLLMGSLSACYEDGDKAWQSDAGHAARAPECTIEADSDVDCLPWHGGHPVTARGGGSNAFMWYWLGRQMGGGSSAVYVAPPALAEPPPRAASVPPSPSRTAAAPTSSRGGFGGSGVSGAGS